MPVNIRKRIWLSSICCQNSPSRKVFRLKPFLITDLSQSIKKRLEKKFVFFFSQDKLLFRQCTFQVNGKNVCIFQDPKIPDHRTSATNEPCFHVWTDYSEISNLGELKDKKKELVMFTSNIRKWTQGLILIMGWIFIPNILVDETLRWGRLWGNCGMLSLLRTS